MTIPNRDPEALHPTLHAGWLEFQVEMEARGHPVFLTETIRSLERQQELYDQGRKPDAPGAIVTYARPGESDHNPNEDGQALAFDFAFSGGEPYSEHHPWEMAGDVLKDLGLLWGGDWRMRDRTHAYYKEDAMTQPATGPIGQIISVGDKPATRSSFVWAGAILATLNYLQTVGVIEPTTTEELGKAAGEAVSVVQHGTNLLTHVAVILGFFGARKVAGRILSATGR